MSAVDACDARQAPQYDQYGLAQRQSLNQGPSNAVLATPGAWLKLHTEQAARESEQIARALQVTDRHSRAGLAKLEITQET